MAGTDPPPPAGDETRGPLIIAMLMLFFGLASIIVCLRLAGRVWINHTVGWDDATIAIAQIFNAVGVGFTMTEISHGLGRHMYYLSDNDYVVYRKMDYFHWGQLFIILPLCKISICLFLLRLAAFEKLIRPLYATIGFLVLSHLPFIVLILLQCRPAQTYWESGVGGTCFSKDMIANVVVAQGVLSILTDFLLAASPSVIFWKLKMGRRTRFFLCILMGLGVITAATSIARTALTWQIIDGDATWVSVPNVLWTIAEVNIGIVAACAPHILSLIHHIRATPSNDTKSLGSTVVEISSHTPWYTRFRRPHHQTGTGWLRTTTPTPSIPGDDSPSSSKRQQFRKSFRSFKGEETAHVEEMEGNIEENPWLALQDIRITTDVFIRTADAKGKKWEKKLENEGV